MYQQIEKEYKVLISKKQYDYFINEVYPHITPIEQKNIYYDTEDGFLSKNKIALRIRLINDKKIVTLKYYDGLDLIELEKEVYCDNPFSEDFNVRETLKKFNINSQLLPCVTITTFRTIIKGEYAEIAIDKNYFHDGSVDYEIEYEVKKAHNDIEVFQSILDKINIKFQSNANSKIKRALHKKDSKWLVFVLLNLA